MYKFNINKSDKPLANTEWSTIACELQIPHVSGIFMRDTLPHYPYSVECDIVYLNTSNQAGSHWICYYRNKNDRIYFDSYGQITPSEIQQYDSEFDRGKEIIQSVISEGQYSFIST